MGYNREVMMTSNFDKLRRQKEAKENRDITLRTIAQETGLSTATVQKIKNATVAGVTLASVDRLCGYFEVKKIDDLITYRPDKDGE